jgi:hypothetical protein
LLSLPSSLFQLLVVTVHIPLPHESCHDSNTGVFLPLWVQEMIFMYIIYGNAGCPTLSCFIYGLISIIRRLVS